MRTAILTATLAALLTLPAPVGAFHGVEKHAIEARQSHMKLLAYNLRLLGDMARGIIDYDANAANAAASNLAAVARLSQANYWINRSSNADVPGLTHALPSIISNHADRQAKINALITAADAMARSAGTLRGVQTAIGAVGGACGSCHKVHRAPYQ